VLYECFTGTHPFMEKFKKNTAKNIIEKEVPFPAEVFTKKMRMVKNFIKHLLQKNYKNRISLKDA
jgi:serine/threonine protein kinase